MKLKHLCIAFAVLMVAGCGGPPKITDTAVPWTNLAVTHACSVDLDVPADKFTVQNLSVRYTRHFRPGQTTANTAVISSVRKTVSFASTPPLANTSPTSHTVFYRWVATLVGTSPGAVSFTLMTPLKRFVVGCTQADTDTQLANVMATHSVNLSTTTPHLRPAQRLLVNSCEPHERAVIAGNGYALSQRGVGVMVDTIQLGGTGGLFDPPVLNIPSLLLFAPQQRSNGETIVDYLADMRDTTSANNPYTLIGVAYTTGYDPDARLLLGWIPSDAWFVHEAGYYWRDGRMRFSSITDEQTGTAGNPASDLPIPGNAALRHPRLKGLHVWFDPAGGPPILSIFEPNTETTPGDPTGPPSAPIFTFFRPQTFE